jgi:hypothetical protein
MTDREPPRRACCLVSEVLEEAGLDREKARTIRRQVLEGLILLCRWQLERMDQAPRPPRRRSGARKVAVE